MTWSPESFIIDNFLIILSSTWDKISELKTSCWSKWSVHKFAKSLGPNFELQSFNKLSLLARSILHARVMFHFRTVSRAISKEEVTEACSCEYFIMRSADSLTVSRSSDPLI